MCKSGVLKLWAGSYDDNQQLSFSLKSELLFGRNLQEVTELKRLGEKDLLLLTGGYDSKIHVYMTDLGAAPSDFKYQFSMPGHFNSIKSLAFSVELNQNAFYLASGSQDNNIRVWKLQPMLNLQNSASEEEKKEEGQDEDEEWMKQFETKTSFVLRDSNDIAYNFSLESVLQHHQEAISSVCWQIPGAVRAENRPLLISDLRLLSSSFDFNVSLWEADGETEAWSVESTLGAMVGNKHAFFGAIFLNNDID